jgi:hypothetical protein
MPERWLVAHIAMLPRLQAEESLHQVQEIIAGDSWLEKRARQEILNAWRQQASGKDPREPEQMTKEQFKARMALMGLAFEDDNDD